MSCQLTGTQKHWKKHDVKCFTKTEHFFLKGQPPDNLWLLTGGEKKKEPLKYLLLAKEEQSIPGSWITGKIYSGEQRFLSRCIGLRKTWAWGDSATQSPSFMLPTTRSGRATGPRGWEKTETASILLPEGKAGNHRFNPRVLAVNGGLLWGKY